MDVLINTKDRAMELGMCLESLRQQTYPDWNLVLVDGSRPKPVWEHPTVHKVIGAIKLDGHDVKLVTEKLLKGIGASRNLAVENSEDEILVRIDDDSVLDPHYLGRLQAVSFNKRKNSLVGGLVPAYGQPHIYKKVPESEKDFIFNKIYFDDSTITLADDGGYLWKSPDKVKQHPEHNKKIDVGMWLPSHHLRSSYLFTRTCWEDVGGFPTEYGKTGFREETDFCLRALLKGYELWTNTGAIAWHIRCESGGVRDQHYQQLVQTCDAVFKEKMKMLFKGRYNEFKK